MKHSILDRAVMAISPQRGLARVRARFLASLLDTDGAYDGAGRGRGNDWVRGAGTSANAEIQGALPTLRNRHRELSRNNGYVSAAIDATVSLTIGDGLKPVARGADEAKVALANDLMREWAEGVACDGDGRLDLFGLQALVMRTESESGEALVLRNVRPVRGQKIPLQIRVLEGDYLDHLRDGVIDGRSVKQGVAFGVGGERAGYYLHPRHPGDGASVYGGSQLVSAIELAHIYEIGRPGQVRGVPRGAAVMARVRNLDQFQDARVRQQMVAA